MTYIKSSMTSNEKAFSHIKKTNKISVCCRTSTGVQLVVLHGGKMAKNNGFVN